MKTDRELLELAARAAGIECSISPHGNLLAHRHPGGGEMRVWNTINDDGDALRLAVKLGIEYCYGYGIDGEVQRVIVDDDLHVMVQGGDTLAATRRAITRAAAQMQLDKATK